METYASETRKVISVASDGEVFAGERRRDLGLGAVAPLLMVG